VVDRQWDTYKVFIILLLLFLFGFFDSCSRSRSTSTSSGSCWSSGCERLWIGKIFFDLNKGND
jgi:hypothetical protein